MLIPENGNIHVGSHSKLTRMTNRLEYVQLLTDAVYSLVLWIKSVISFYLGISVLMLYRLKETVHVRYVGSEYFARVIG